MSTPAGQYGGLKYESPQSRALESINLESYQKVYDDEGAFLSKLANDTSYMAQYMRQMQQGIDQSDENFIQQIQDLIADIQVIMGGQGDTGFDFGDLKYVLEAIGSLFGFTDDNGDITTPINLFTAAWHFFSNYIMPTGNFEDTFNDQIDSMLNTMLDVFGEVPIVGQEVEQFAEWISAIRDDLDPIIAALTTLFNAFNVNIGDTDGIMNLFAPYSSLLDALTGLFQDVNIPDLTPVLQLIQTWTIPFIDDLVDGINGLTAFIKVINGDYDLTQLNAVLTDLFNILGAPALGTDLNPTTWAISFIDNILKPTNLLPSGPIFDDISNWNQDMATDLTKAVVALKQIVVQFNGTPDIDTIVAWAQTLTQIDPTTGTIMPEFLTEGLQQLSNWGEQQVNDINNALVGLKQIVLGFNATDDLAALAGWAQTLPQIDLNTGTIVDDFIGSINANKIFGQIESDILGVLPLSKIVNTNYNQQVSSAFPTAASIANGGSDDWVFDAVNGHSSPGCISVIADGTPHALQGSLISTAAGKTVSANVYVEWSGLTATGTPIKLQVKFDNGQIIDVATFTAPLSATQTWTQLSGSTTVPVGATQFRMRLYVDPSATAGTIRWDDGQDFISGLLQQDWVQDLIAQFTGVASMFNLSDISSLIDLNPSEIWETIIDDLITPLEKLAGLDGSGKLQLPQVPDFINQLSTAVTQLGQLFDNQVVTPINTVVSQAQSWFAQQVSDTESLFTNLFGTTTLQPKLAQSALPAYANQSDLISGVQSFFDSLVPILQPGNNATGNSPSQVANAASSTVTTALQAQASAIAALTIQAQQTVAKNPIDASIDSTFDLALISPGFTAGGSTSAACPRSYVVMKDSVDKLAVVLLAQINYNQGTMTNVYVNVYKVDTSTGVETRVWASTDVMSYFPTNSSTQANNYKFVYLDMPSALSVAPGDIYSIEIVPIGGSLMLAYQFENANYSTYYLPANTFVWPQKFLAMRNITNGGNSPASIATPSYPQQSMPFWAGLSAGAPVMPRSPQPQAFTSTSAQTYTPASWMEAGDFIDYVMVGSGQGGGGDGSVGAAGKWLSGTLVYGTDVKIGSTITVTQGAGGSNSYPYLTPGNVGGAATIQYTDPSNVVHTISLNYSNGTAGYGASGSNAGTYTYQSSTYKGGAAASAGFPGSPPGGGGGAGGSGGSFGGSGANSETWIIARQATV